MQYNEDAQLDTSGVQDARGGGFGGFGRGGLALGGGGLGVAGLVIYLLFALIGGGGSGTTDVLGSLDNSGATADNKQVAAECKTGKDANENLDCAVVADIDSIQNFWTAQLPKLGKSYQEVPTVWFTGQVSTGCGAASSGSGPFYCPADKRVYLDLSFYDDLTTQFGARGGLFVDAYVLAHEYGHHVQDLLGIESKVRSREGAKSDSVRLELQADCYAGVWANHATTVPDDTGKPLISDVTQDDIDRALDTAGRIGDDYIQKNLGSGHIDQNSFTHGSSAQREKWFSTGYRTGDPKACDTFGTDDLG
ncbi:MAG TPA: neutral zinc metallopeptidase [Jatrophihabitantaceae bacterium]|nr:neutral zinc metallopeptidase [Jatrophihabitantaceae bacterium]